MAASPTVSQEASVFHVTPHFARSVLRGACAFVHVSDAYAAWVGFVPKHYIYIYILICMYILPCILLLLDMDYFSFQMVPRVRECLPNIFMSEISSMDMTSQQA